MITLNTAMAQFIAIVLKDSYMNFITLLPSISKSHMVNSYMQRFLHRYVLVAMEIKLSKNLGICMTSL